MGGATPDAVLGTDVTGLAPNTLDHWRARLEYASRSAIQSLGQFSGPRRRFGAQVVAADVRTGGSAACNNGLDDDGYIDDPADPGCTSPADTSEREAGIGLICDDGSDQDGDLLSDYAADSDCGIVTSLEENPQCNDGIDDDGDNLIDHPADPGCAGYASNDFEVPRSSCGLLGFEACAALIIAARLRMRRNRTSAGSRMEG